MWAGNENGRLIHTHAPRGVHRQPTRKCRSLSKSTRQTFSARNSRPATQQTDELDDSALHDADRALVGSNGNRADGRGLVGECGRGAASEPASIAAPTRTTASPVDLTDDSANCCCNGAIARRATSERDPCKTTWPRPEPVRKLNIRLLPALTPTVTSHWGPTYQRQLGIDDTSETPRPAKLCPPMNTNETRP